MKPLRVLLVDDEPLARRRLQIALADMPELAVAAGAASSCETAVRQAEALAPDVMLLDIAMRDGTGFDVLNRLAQQPSPVVIFVTAFDHFAVRAFEASAVDYLLKPVAFDRLRTALERAREKLASRDAGEQIDELRAVVATLRSAEPSVSQGRRESEFWIRRGSGGFVRVSAAAIDWVAVEDDYVRLHVGEQSHLLRESIRGLRTRLDPDAFIQVHRKTIVRLDAIREMTSGKRGAPEVILLSGERLHVGRVYARTLRQRFRAH